MPIAKEGFREIALATVILGACAVGFGYWFWPLAAPFIIVWLWVLSFFRDPKRQRTFQPGELCAPADGTVTEISSIDDSPAIGGPAIRLGVFLSLFDVHINRSPCKGRIRSLAYQAGEFLDARHPESGRRNESNTVLIDPDAPMPGPVEVRQIAGLVARRIVCHAEVNDRLAIADRFGLIKFGSRTELLIPRRDGTEIVVRIGDKVRAGLTVVARQPMSSSDVHQSGGDDPEAAHGESGGETVAGVSRGAGR